jgi:hypothetical protein
MKITLRRVASALMIEAVSTSETSVNFCETTWRDIPKDSRRQDNELPVLKRVGKF